MTLIQALFRRLVSRSSAVASAPVLLSAEQFKAVSGGDGEAESPRHGW